MPVSACYLFKNSFEFFPVADISKVPKGVRGIYVLYHSKRGGKMDVVYVGMARGEKGVVSRLRRHRKKKPELWTHFSVFEVWDNITKEQVEELEALFRHIYRCDSSANKLNVQKGSKKLLSIRRRTPAEWHL